MGFFLTLLHLIIFMAAAVGHDSEDMEIAGGILRGDVRSFQRFYEKYHLSLISFLTSKGVPLQEAEDLVQNVFVILWEKRRTIQPGSSLRAFVYTIAYRRMLNFFRDQKKQEPDFAYRLKDEGVDPSESAHFRQAMQTMQQALERMPEKRRRVFELCYLKEFSYKETAEILGIARKTVENHMIQALKDLRKELKAYMPGMNH